MALRKPKKVEQPNWHANFRNVETLPDIKVIRTDFFVNFCAITLACGLLFFAGYREFKGHSLKKQISDLTSKISAAKAENDSNLRKSGQFEKLSGKITELDRFESVPIEPQQFLLLLSETLPREILTQSISYNDQQIRVGRKNVLSKAIQFRGSVSGDPETATQIVTDFIKTLENNETFGSILNKIEVISLDRDERIGGMSCVIRIELKSA